MSNAGRYKIPILDLQAQYQKLRGEIHQAIDGILETQQFILGPAVQKFEEQSADYLKARFAIGVASGSDALLLALMALDIGPRDGVIVTPFTFFSTASAITRLGARPLFVDIDPGTFLLSTEAIRTFLEERLYVQGEQSIDRVTGLRVKALLPVHLFGQCCDMTQLGTLANEYQLQMIEDVAQACGARTSINGQIQYAGTVGDLGCFSFFPSKTLGGYGDGGLVTTDREDLAEKVRKLRMHGETTKYHHQLIGINSRLDSIQASVLTVKLRYLDEWCDQRIEKAQIYKRLFEKSGIVGKGLLSIPAPATDKSHVFNNYVIRAERRDDLKQFLEAQGIQSEIYYPLPLHLQPCFASLGYRGGEFPQAELVATQVLALPLYPELTIQQQETVVNRINDFYRSERPL